jgi:hypothetical protein
MVATTIGTTIMITVITIGTIVTMVPTGTIVIMDPTIIMDPIGTIIIMDPIGTIVTMDPTMDPIIIIIAVHVDGAMIKIIRIVAEAGARARPHKNERLETFSIKAAGEDQP